MRICTRKQFLLFCAMWLVPALSAVLAGTPSKGLLWKIERAGASASYLLGTIHSEDPRVMKLAPAVQRPFDASASFTMEVILDMQAMIDSTQAMLFADGNDLRKVLGAPLYGKVAPLMSDRGVPESMLNTFKPWAVFVTLSMPKQRTGVFLDSALFGAAVEQNKRIYGLESVQEQLGVFDRMTLAEQTRLVADTVKNYGQLNQAFEEMIAAYLKRDLAALQAVSDKYSAMDDKQLTDRLMTELIDVRNLRMIERMVPRLREGNAFIAVGALHLPGKQGLLQLLEQQGYRVTAVY